MGILANDNTQQALNTASDVLRRWAHSFFNFRSLIVLAVSIGVALLVGRIVAFLLRKLVLLIGQRADKTEDLHVVNRLRRYETVLVLSIAVVRTLLIVFALYFWWMFIHPSGQPTALIGASALTVIIISGAFSPVLRDVAAGSFMMAEHWYGVGDYVRLEPFVDLEGVVERVTLRSTRIRSLNGEITWVGNQNIAGVRLAPKGIRSLALEIFVSDLAAGKRLINATNKRLPVGPLLLLSPLEIVSDEQVGDNLWHITAVGETAPGREWLIEKSAVDLIKELDEKNRKPALQHGPLARFADTEAERRFRRTITNARKRPTAKRRRAAKAAAASARRQAANS